MRYTLRTCECLRPDCYDLRIEAPDLCAAARPGQFVHVDCGEIFTLRRPISIAGAEDGLLRLIVEVRGAGTARLAAWGEGQAIDILGPLGKGYTLAPDRNYLLVGGGLGVPPLRYVAAALRAAGRPAAAVLGFRTASAALLVEEMGALCRTAAVSTDDGTLGTPGRADMLAAALLDAERFDAVLACGPYPLLRSLARITKERGIFCQVSMEERMGCGVGACLVCACATAGGYARVCADGPVFDARAIGWEGQ